MENMTSLRGFNNTTAVPDFEEDPLPFEKFAPTLAQCFFIVLAGYFVGRVQMLSASDLRGVTVFAAYFAMPGIICISLADSDLRNLEWQLLVGIVIGKAVIFAIVAGCTLLFTNPPDVPLAGMLAMFCVQCNDLPVGNPLISNLYGELRPEMLKYLFLIPALTLIFFGPVSYAMMEIPSSTRTFALSTATRLYKEDSRTSVYSRVSCKIRYLIFHQMTQEVIVNLLKNPVTIATFLGIILNISFKAHVPSVLHRPINVVATMIPGLALSVLGFSMLGKERHIFSSGIVLALVLIAVKIVLTPLVLYVFVWLLAKEDHKDLLDFSLLYGIISPAAIIFQFGEKYRLPVAAMSAALILSSFICFPLSYVIAKLTLLPHRDLNHYIAHLNCGLVFVASGTIVCCILVGISFIWNKQYRKPPCCYIVCLIFCQAWMSCGIILWVSSDVKRHWTMYGTLILACGGEIATYIWTAMLSIILVLHQSNPSTLKNSFVLLLILTFGITALVVAVLCFLIFKEDFTEVLLFGQPIQGYEYIQLSTTTSILFVSLIVVGTSFALYVRRKGSVENFRGAVPMAIESEKKEGGAYTIDLKNSESPDDEKRISSISTASTVQAFNEQDEKTLYYDEVVKTSQTQKSLVFGSEWTFRYITLITFLLTTMIVRLLSNTIKLSHCKTIAILLPLEYVQAVLFTGQGLWTFLTFGVDLRTAFISLKKRWRKMHYGERLFQPDPSDAANEEAQKTCDQFRTFFYSHCFQELAKERLWKKNIYGDSFWGHQLVNWLLKAGLAKDELEAEEYGQKLLLGEVISHIRKAHNFYNAPYLYYFVKTAKSN